MWLDKDTHDAIQKWWEPYARQNKIPRNALFFVKDYQRSYPFGKLLGQVLHTIQNQKEEKTDRALPTGGLELYFNSYLQGTNGKRRLMRSPRNSLETGEVIDYPQHGSDIYLTINPVLQAIAEEEIEKGVVRSKGKCGWAAIMNPHSGEILALAQYPFFHPADYQKFFNDAQLIEHTKVKAITDANEPGSVFKPFTIAIALKANDVLLGRGEKELFSPDEKIATRSGRFPGRSRPIADTKVHDYLNLDMGMQKSSNIYMERLVERIINRLGNDWFRLQLQSFGFGEKTRIELPAESSGVVPTPGKKHPNGALEWSLPTPFSLAIGHNIQVTTLQLLRAYAVLANGGYLVQPTLVRCIVNKNSNETASALLDNLCEEHIKQFPKVLDDHVVKRVVQAMRYVTKPGGTAIKADVSGFTEVGKTSTPKKIIHGKYSERLYCPIFAGFIPVQKPEMVIVVTIDEPQYGYLPGVIGKNHHGGNCTALVFNGIAKRSLEYLGIPPDDPFGYPYGDPRRDTKKEVWMNETRKLQEIYDQWNKVPQTKP
jgi:cell division protein FtsI (penicillin-binding protein 3)